MATTIANRIGVPSDFGNKTITVGPGGDYPTWVQAQAARNNINSLTSIATFDATCSASLAAGDAFKGRMIIADSSTPLASYIGQRVAVQVDGAGSYIAGTVVDDNDILMDLPPTTFSATSIEVFTITPVTILFLPGYAEVYTGSTTLTLNSFTTYKALSRGSAKFTYGLAGTTNKVLNVIAGATEIYIENMVISQIVADSGTPANRLIDVPSTPTQLNATSLYIKNCELYGSHIDTIFYSASAFYGRLHITDSYIEGYYDLIRLGQMRDVLIDNCDLVAWSTISADEVASCIRFGRSVSTTETGIKNRYVITNNRMHAIGSGAASGGSIVAVIDFVVACIDCTGQLSSDDDIIIANNYIHAECIADSNIIAAGDKPTYTIRFNDANTDANTPSIILAGNTHVAATAWPAGTVKTIHQAAASYTVNTVANVNIAGSVGSNTTSLEATSY